MRKLVLLSIFICAAVITVSCATTSASGVAGVSALVKEKESSDEGQIFSDWEYRGFGRELPGWVTPFFEGGMDAVRAACPAYEGKDILVIYASGTDADQADNALVVKLTNDVSHSGYVLTESIWVCLKRDKNKKVYNGDPYVSLCLYVKPQKM